MDFFLGVQLHFTIDQYVVVVNSEKIEAEEGIDKPPLGRYNIFWGRTRRMKDMKEKILHEI